MVRECGKSGGKKSIGSEIEAFGKESLELFFNPLKIYPQLLG